MVSRTVKINSSLSGTLIRYVIQIKVNNKWYNLKIHGIVKLFDNPYHANNYGLKLNKHHKILEV